MQCGIFNHLCFCVRQMKVYSKIYKTLYCRKETLNVCSACNNYAKSCEVHFPYFPPQIFQTFSALLATPFSEIKQDKCAKTAITFQKM